MSIAGGGSAGQKTVVVLGTATPGGGFPVYGAAFADTVHETELDRRIGQLVHEPSASDLIHPRRHGRGELSGPEQTELAVPERSKGLPDQKPTVSAAS